MSEKVPLDPSGASGGRDGTVATLYVVAGAGLVGAVAVFCAIFAVLPESDRVDLLREIASVAISFVPLIFFSVVVATLVQRRDAKSALRDRELQVLRTQQIKDAERERDRAERSFDARHAFRIRLIETYNKSKGARRMLRGSGLRPDSGITITAAHLDALDDQMRAVIDAQLTMEQLKRESDSQSAPFKDRAGLRIQLSTIEEYLGVVVKDWEEGRPTLRVGDPASKLAEWQNYADFVAHRDAKRRSENPTKAFKMLEEIVLGELQAE